MIFVCQVYGSSVYCKIDSTEYNRCKAEKTRENEHQHDEIEAHQQRVNSDDVRYTVRFVLTGHIFPNYASYLIH